MGKPRGVLGTIRSALGLDEGLDGEMGARVDPALASLDDEPFPGSKPRPAPVGVEGPAGAAVIPSDPSSLRDRYGWKRVEAPRMWAPKDPGEELIGFYGGKSVRTGAYGEYSVVLVHIPRVGARMISGVQIAQLVDAAGIDLGWPIRVVWKGKLDLGDGKKMKHFDVFVAEGDPAAPEDLPLIRDPKEKRQ